MKNRHPKKQKPRFIPIDVDVLREFVEIDTETNDWHFDIPKALKYFGYPVTEENKELMTEVLLKCTKKVFPNVPHKVVKATDN